MAGGSTFFAAFVFLSPARRRALNAVYAFCRAVDDAVDEVDDPAAALVGLDFWRAELDRALRGAPTHPVGVALAAAARRFPLPPAALAGIVDGCRMDLEQRRYRTWEELRAYCYGVASCVGLTCIEIFGYADAASARAYAEELGIALQLTNILRDLPEDAARGRLYLPLDELEEHGCVEADLLEGRLHPGARALLRVQGARARAHYLRARARLSAGDRRALVPAEIMGDLYLSILDELERADFDVWRHPVRMGRRRRLALAATAFLRRRVLA